MGRKKSVNKTAEVENLENAAFATGGDSALTSEPAKETKKTKTTKHKSLKKKEIVRGKKYLLKNALVDKNRLYNLNEAIELCQKASLSKFDGSLELHLNLGLKKDSEQKVRVSTILPHGTGKKVSIMAFVSADKSGPCQAAGADLIGNEQTIEDILNKGAINFDRVVATPDFMPKLTKIAKILGPKGLMPSPKNGTVTAEPEKIIKELKRGKLEIRTEANAPIIHLSLGKLSSSAKDLSENFLEVIKMVKEAKPKDARADYLVSAFLSPTMGPSVKLDLSFFS